MLLSELATALAYAAVAYREEVTDEMVDVYYDQVGHHGAENFVNAVRRHVSRSDRFPTVHDLRLELSVDTRVTDPVIEHNSRVIRAAKQARLRGATPDEVMELVSKLDNQVALRGS